MATLTVEQQLQKLKEKEKALKAKIKKEKEKAELQELKKMQKYMKYINADTLKNIVDYILNKNIEAKNYDGDKLEHKFTEEEVKKLIQLRLKDKPTYYEIEKLKKL